MCLGLSVAIDQIHRDNLFKMRKRKKILLLLLKLLVLFIVFIIISFTIRSVRPLAKYLSALWAVL